MEFIKYIAMDKIFFKYWTLYVCLFLWGTVAFAQKYHDAAMYDLKGNVRKCTLYINKVKEMEREFLSDGRWDCNFEINRNANGYVENYEESVESLGLCTSINYEYDSFGNVNKELYTSVLVSREARIGTIAGIAVTKYIRNDRGLVIQINESEGNIAGRKKENAHYSNHKFDSHGNWIYRVKTSENGEKEVETRTIAYWNEGTSNQHSNGSEEKENPFTKLSNMARNDAITFDKRDITVADLLRIPFYNGNGMVTKYDLEKSMGKYPQTFYSCSHTNMGSDNDYMDDMTSFLTKGIKFYGNVVSGINYTTRLSTPIDFGNVKSYIIGFGAYVECQDAKSKKEMINKLIAEFEATSITMEKYSLKVHSTSKGWKGSNTQYKIMILSDKKYDGDNRFSVLVEYKNNKERYKVTIQAKDAIATKTQSTEKHDFVDLGLSVKWATCNVGASSPEEYGDYYAWGEINPKSNYNERNSITYSKDMEDISGNPQYDAARANWGGTWRMPTAKEMIELVKNCTAEWVQRGNVWGMLVTSKKNGNSIFLPAAGYKTSKYTFNVNEQNTSYWTSSPFQDGKAIDFPLHFSKKNLGHTISGRDHGQCIRPVTE